jgi:hypothetical protein
MRVAPPLVSNENYRKQIPAVEFFVGQVNQDKDTLQSAGQQGGRRAAHNYGSVIPLLPLCAAT